MKTFLLLLSILFSFSELCADKPQFTFKLEDGTVKSYDIDEIEEISFSQAKGKYSLAIYYHDEQIIINTKRILGIKFWPENSFDTLIVYQPRDINLFALAEIDSISLIQYFESSIDMVYIPAGKFRMGNTGKHAGLEYGSQKFEYPVHEVELKNSFYMSKYEITQKQYEDIMGENPAYIKGDNYPIVDVEWIWACKFCNMLSEKEGLEKCYVIKGDTASCYFNRNGYRLPTEAEWEYACRAGTSEDTYYGNITTNNDSILDPQLDKIAWYNLNSDSSLKDIGLKEPNKFGLYDMIGNASEWCWDWYNSDIYNHDAVDPKGSINGTHKIIRGGSFYTSALENRSSYRYGYWFKLYIPDVGFRVVRGI